TMFQAIGKSSFQGVFARDLSDVIHEIVSFCENIDARPLRNAKINRTATRYGDREPRNRVTLRGRKIQGCQLLLNLWYVGDLAIVGFDFLRGAKGLAAEVIAKFIDECGRKGVSLP